MRVAVTGADGFVGRHLCAHLAERGDDVLPLAGPPSSGGASAADATVIDILAPETLTRVLSPFAPDALIHLAGMSSVARSHEAPTDSFRVNALGALHLCEVLRRVAPKARLLLIGSGEMYGSIVAGARATEASPLIPTSPYAASKVAAEVMAMQFHRSYGLDVVSARPFNHLGRGQAATFAVPSFARQLVKMEGAGRLLVGDLAPVRDFSHVEDVVRAYRILLEHGIAGESYNVCSGVGRTVRSVVEEMIVASNVDARLEVDPARVRPVELPYLVGDPSKLHALGWLPRRTVRDALDEALADARETLG